MAEIDLTQGEADSLIAMEKHREDNEVLDFPNPGERLAVPLTSPDKRELFMLDVTRAHIKLTKATFQNRTRQAVVLLRLDIDGPPHRNPDGVEIPCPHLHIYREDYGVKWASQLPVDLYPDTLNFFSMFGAFMKQCNITLPPQFNFGLF
jgi:hypothetical protein